MTDQRYRRHPGRTRPSTDYARTIVYAPDLDGSADPGEIVWTWVPYEDDPTQGKDRPALVVGHRGTELVGLMLSSKAHHRDDENWISIGSGAWDYNNRESYVRLDRVLVIDEHGIRREGSVCRRDVFDAVAEELRRDYGWQ